jgi:thiol-disulfide isomerase/thioredoxin
MSPSSPSPSHRRRPSSSRAPLRGWLIGGVLAAIIGSAAVVAVVTTAGDDDTAGLEQTRPVVVSGAPLAAFVDGQDAAIGTVAPAISGASFDGSPIDIAPGRPTLVVFLAHWCPVCQREVPILVDWAARGGVPDGATVIGVTTGTGRDRPNYPPSSWLAREGFPFPVLADSDESEVAAAFGLRSYPFFTVLDGDGRVVVRASGALDPDALTALLEQLD